MKRTIPFVLLLAAAIGTYAQPYRVDSPSGTITLTVEAGAMLRWSVSAGDQAVIAPSEIGMRLGDGSVLGENVKVSSAPTRGVNDVIHTVNFFRTEVTDHYNELTLNCRGNYGIVFRAYNDAVAYRFFTKVKGEIVIQSERANFNFTSDYSSFVPVQWDYRGGQNFNSSFEALYREIHLSAFPKDSLAFLPVLVDVGQGKKVVVLEADLEDYPGMYLDLNETEEGLKGVYAPYPLEVKPAGWSGINLIPTKRADYIAKTTGTRSFPWRVVVISSSDKELLDNDIVQRLASPTRMADVSWIEPGQVAWDWWNNWNISHVDFAAGINTETYKYYIDFAAANGIRYIVMDDGWSKRDDLSSINPDIDLQGIVAHGKQKNVGVILWATWSTILKQMDEVFPKYAAMGVKGFKIDFIDRDDQLAVASTYDIAKKAAANKLLVDYHGIFKPTGLQRTWPNVISYEGVKGLENYKWANEDQPRYAVTIPYIRMMAGPMDYTPGAMRNASQSNFRPINGNPMSKGTRCNQMAMYVMYYAPLQMLSDNPTTYMKEQECTDFLVKVPVTYDETVPLDGVVGEYAVVARRKGNAWFIGAMTNWTARNLTVDLSFLPSGTYRASVFKDGVNADRDGTDYKQETIEVQSGNKIAVHMAPGGGWTARLEKVR